MLWSVAAAALAKEAIQNSVASSDAQQGPEQGLQQGLAAAAVYDTSCWG